MDTFACSKAFQTPPVRWSTPASLLRPRVHRAFLRPRHGDGGARGTLQHRKGPLVLCRLAGREESRARKQQQQQQQGKEMEEPALQDTSPKPTQEHVNSGRRRFLTLRLRGRLRLALRQLRRWSPLAILQALLRYARLHSKQVAFSTLFGCIMTIGCLCLKLSSAAVPHVVPYSELVSHLRSGAVSTVLFEEGSRQLFFNLRTVSEPTTEGETEAHEDMSKQGITKEYEDTHQQAMVQGSGTELSSRSMQMQDGMDKAAGVEPSSRKASVVSMVLSSLKSVASAPEQLLKSDAHPWKYSTRRIDNDEAYLLSLMRDKGVMYSSAPQPMSAALRTTLITILSLWIPLTPLFWLMHRQFSGGNAAAQRRRVNSTSVKFEDVAGVDEAKLELMEIVSYLRGATNFRKIGAKLPRGVLLVGPPGTGKTLLARAVAGEARVPFFAASASEFVEMFVGRGAARIRELFTGARKCAPSIIFIDELDAVGGRRGRSFNDERDQTLNQLLTEMDGFESETGVLVIAATNRPEALDSALCRPGRFSRKVFVREPDLKGREQVLAVHMRGVPVDGDAEFIQTAVASITQGFVGADLANVVNEAALLAVREGRLAVTLEDLKGAVNRVKYGIGNQPGFVEREVSRLFDWFQPKVLKSAPAGYETAPWSG